MTIADSARPNAVTSMTTAPAVVHTDLRKGSIGLAGVLMQSVAQISPTLGIFYTIAFNTGQAGKAAPLTYLAAFIVCLIIAAFGWCLLHLRVAWHRPPLGVHHRMALRDHGDRRPRRAGGVHRRRIAR
jgi:hypothetical protein